VNLAALQLPGETQKPGGSVIGKPSEGEKVRERKTVKPAADGKGFKPISLEKTYTEEAVIREREVYPAACRPSEPKSPKLAWRSGQTLDVKAPMLGTSPERTRHQN